MVNQLELQSGILPAEEFIFMNEGIEGRSINKLLQFPLLDIPSVIACTDSGAYYLSEYSDIDQTEIIPPCIELKSFPNPAYLSRSTARLTLLQRSSSKYPLRNMFMLKSTTLKDRKLEPCSTEKYRQDCTSWNGMDRIGAGEQLVRGSTSVG